MVSAAASGTASGADMAEDDGLWPKYHRVYLVLRQQIEDGTYGPATQMPSESSLAQDFGVSRITIRKAMERLVREGIVNRARGKGTFARAMAARSPVAASLSGSIENLIALGLETEVRVIEFGYDSAPAEVCQAMGCAKGTSMQRALRVRALHGRPFSHLTTWLPEDIGRTFDRAALEATPMLQLIEAAGCRIATARQTISACHAPPDVAGLLGIEPGSALLWIRRRVFDEGGRPVEWLSGLYRPDTYEHETAFERERSNGKKFWNI